MIYILEDDNSIRELVAYTLNQSGLPALGFALPSAFWAALRAERPQLVLLDIMLPEEDGLSILKKLRSAPDTRALPVMMLTAKGSEYDKVVGLDSGADDYLPKPFGMMELISRVKALLRRTAEPECAEPEEFRLGALCVSPARHLATVCGQSVALTYKEFELLCLLLANPGIVFTRDALLNRIWGYDYDGESRTVDVHIRSLRQKLGTCAAYIETVRGVGYRAVVNIP
ncbi:MAG: DNA-binding response regulator [Clostridiales bacterium]|nr:MAG: DNA-binding response regulator [Clostridiales bacterium]PWL53421.1 MAG: DNA-binding response regulator [Clostridiales bacterium]